MSLDICNNVRGTTAVGSLINSNTKSRFHSLVYPSDPSRREVASFLFPRVSKHPPSLYNTRNPIGLVYVGGIHTPGRPFTPPISCNAADFKRSISLGQASTASPQCLVPNLYPATCINFSAPFLDFKVLRQDTSQFLAPSTFLE